MLGGAVVPGPPTTSAKFIHYLIMLFYPTVVKKREKNILMIRENGNLYLFIVLVSGVVNVYEGNEYETSPLH